MGFNCHRHDTNNPRHCPDDVVGLLATELKHQINNPPGGDIYLSALSEATLELIGVASLIKVVRDVYGNKPGVTGSQMVNGLQKGFGIYALSDPEYPRGYDNTKWQQTILTVLNNGRGKDFGDLYVNLSAPVQSNIPQRYITPKLFFNLYQRDDKPRHIFDIGTSGGLGMVQLFEDYKLPFRPVGAVNGPIYGHNGEIIGHDIDWQFHPQIVAAQRDPIKLGLSVGLDLFDFHDQVVKNRIKGHSFRPNELLDPDKIQLFNSLAAAKPPNLKFKFADATHFDAREFSKEYPGLEFDAVFISTMLWRLGENERVAVLKSVQPLLKDDGVIIVQDFAKKDASGAIGLVFVDDWYKFGNYATFVYPKGNINDPFEYLMWGDGRPEVLVRGAGALALEQTLGLKLKAA